MKIITSKFFVTALYLLCSFATFGRPMPPAPTQRRPPPPPGIPIDENILFFVMFSVFFGIYIVYNQTIKTKTPI